MQFTTILAALLAAAPIHVLGACHNSGEYKFSESDTIAALTPICTNYLGNRHYAIEEWAGFCYMAPGVTNKRWNFLVVRYYGIGLYWVKPSECVLYLRMEIENCSRGGYSGRGGNTWR